MDDVTIIIQPIAPINITVEPIAPVNITVSQTGPRGPSGVLPITVVSDDIVMAVGNGYQANDPDDPVIFNFPLTPATGNICAIYGGGAGGFMLALRSGEVLQITGSANTVSGPSGFIQNTNVYDSATFTYLAPNWIAVLNGCSIN